MRDPLADVRPPRKIVLSIVVPVFNEAPNVAAMVERCVAAVRSAALPFEIVFVDDGSTDDSFDRIRKVSRVHPQVRAVRLARNFGHQAAIFAGLEHAVGDAVITLDGDLQHPPELIPALIERWQAGFDVVQAVRTQPADESAVKRAASRGFYRLLSAVSRISVTPGAADFRLMSRSAVGAFLACRERCRFNRGLVQWIGFRTCEIPYDAQPRNAGRTKYSYRAMFHLAGDAIFSFSTWPLRFAGFAGLTVSIAAAGYLAFVLWAYWFTDRTEPGWSSLLAAVLILGGMQLLVLWILGEYVGRLYEEAKQRPLYIIRSDDPAARADSTQSTADIVSAKSDEY